MAPPQLTDYQEIIVDLPDRRKLTVSRLTPLTNNDNFRVMPTASRGASSVVGFLESSNGTPIAASDFYLVGSAVPLDSFYVQTTTLTDAGLPLVQDTVRIADQKRNTIVFATLHSDRFRSFVQEIE